MEMFKEASKLKLRFHTTKGPLTTEQLWDLSLKELDNLAVTLEEIHNKSKRKSFLERTSDEDKAAKLGFDIVLDILNTKVEAEQAAKEARETKEHNNKIITLIAEKRDESLKGKTVEELEAMLK